MKLFRPTGMVLVMLSLMYMITYIDRVNVSTASVGGWASAEEVHPSKTEIGLGLFRLRLIPICLFQIIGGWVERPLRHPPHPDRLQLHLGLCHGSSRDFAGGLVSL
jgi:hypothetical protein